jgi:hypothetical protein
MHGKLNSRLYFVSFPILVRLRKPSKWPLLILRNSSGGTSRRLRNVLFDMYWGLAGELRIAFAPFLQAKAPRLPLPLPRYLSFDWNLCIRGIECGSRCFLPPSHASAFGQSVLAQARCCRLLRPSPHLPLSPVAADLRRSVSRSSPAIECEAVKCFSVPQHVMIRFLVYWKHNGSELGW